MCNRLCKLEKANIYSSVLTAESFFFYISDLLSKVMYGSSRCERPVSDCCGHRVVVAIYQLAAFHKSSIILIEPELEADILITIDVFHAPFDNVDLNGHFFSFWH